MLEQLSQIIPGISIQHLNILLLLGLALVGGTIGGRLFQILRIPQVVGYIIIGILIGQVGLSIVGPEVIEIMEPFNYFALGLIGFMIGGEFKKDVLKRYGKQLSTILLSEGLTAFLFVFLFVGFFGSLFFEGHFWVIGLLLGALASATAPAATTDVLWEYKAKGPLTTTIYGIVALDDGLSLIIFAVVTNIASNILGTSSGTILSAITNPIYKIGGAIVIGIISGLALSKILRKYNKEDKLLAFSLGAVLFVLGISLALKVSMLLAAMTLGMVVVNRIPEISKKVFKIVNGFSAPIYVLFFVLVGAKLNLKYLTLPVIFITGIYIIARTLGKMLGSNMGARISGTPASVRKYLPFCLFSQAGVAIGLSIVAYHTFPPEIGSLIVAVITSSTFVVQIIGPPATKYAITRAEEAGLNITEEDLIKRTKLEEVMDKNPPIVYENVTLPDILNIFSKHEYFYYPVVDMNKRLKGIITVESVKHAFLHSEVGSLLLAHDIMEPVNVTASANSSLIEVKEILDRYNLDYLPVVKEDNKIIGFTERRMINKFISTKIIELEQKASSLAKT